MKKIAFMSALVLALGFTACDGYEEPNAPAQSNPQESILQTDQVQVTGDIVGGTVYSLANLNNNNENIKVATIKCATLPEGYTFVAKVEASTNAFETAFEVPSTVTQMDSTDVYEVFVTPDNLNGVYVSNVTKNPAQVTLNVRFNVLTQVDEQLAYVGGPSNVYTTENLTIAPFAPDHVIENAYYIVGSFCNWTVSQAQKFNQTVEGDPYDNPVFTTVVEITNDQAAGDGYQFKIIPQSTFAAGTMNDNADYGCNPILVGGMEGYLSTDAPNGVIKTAGRYLVTINMEKLTYKFESAFEYLSVPYNIGSSISASQWENNFFRLATSDYVNYSGFSRLYQKWFLSTMPAMDGINFMQADSPVTDEATGVVTGSLIQTPEWANATMMTVAANGMYKIDVNILALTYTLRPINTISLVGAFNDWNVEAGAELKPGSASRITHWTATGLHMSEGEFKLVANHSWEINWGGQFEDLVQDGANLAITEEGDYDFELVFNPAGGLVTLTVTKK